VNVMDVTKRIMMELKIQIIVNPDFPPIVNPVTGPLIPAGKAAHLITILYFHLLDVMLLHRVHHVIRMEFTKERRVIVMDVIARIMIQPKIQTIGNPDSQHNAIAVINLRILIGTGLRLITISSSDSLAGTLQFPANRAIEMAYLKERRLIATDVIVLITIRRAIQIIDKPDSPRIVKHVIRLLILIGIVLISITINSSR
jgi:hypothetical protein